MGSEPGTTPTSNRCAFRTLIVIVGILALANVVLVILLVTTLAGSNDQNKPFTNTACATQCAPLCVVESDSSCFKGCYHSCDAHMQFVRPAALSEWILPNAIQHTGITTSNLTRSYLFYTEILGGVEVLNAGGDGWKGDSVYVHPLPSIQVGAHTDPPPCIQVHPHTHAHTDPPPIQIPVADAESSFGRLACQSIRSKPEYRRIRITQCPLRQVSSHMPINNTLTDSLKHTHAHTHTHTHTH